MKQFDIERNELRNGNRFVPAFYFYNDIIEELELRLGIDTVRVSDWCDVSDGEHSAIPRLAEGPVRYLYGRNIKEGVVNFDPITDLPFITEENYDAFTRCHIQEGDVLIAIYGTVGKSAVYRGEYVGKAGIPRHIASISVHQDAPFSAEYLSAFFRSRYGKQRIISLMTGNNQQLLSLDCIRDMSIPLGPKSFIDRVGELEKKALQYEIQAEVMIREAQKQVYDGLNFEVDRIKKQLSFSACCGSVKAAESWSPNRFSTLYEDVADALKRFNAAVPLGSIAVVGHGVEPGSLNYYEYLDAGTGFIPFIRTSDIVNYEADYYPDYYLDPGFVSAIGGRFCPGDVLFTKDGKIGCVGLVTDADDVVFGSGVANLRLNHRGIELGMTQEYLFAVLSVREIGRYASARRTVVASTIPHLRPAKLREIEIPVMDREIVANITNTITKAFEYKVQRKQLLRQIDAIMVEQFAYVE